MRLPFILDPARAALALGIAAAVVTVLYLLRERYRPILVSYLPLWEQSIRKSTPLALARRLRKLLSLLLQMAIIAMTVWAMTDPTWGKTREPTNVVLLVDVSPSMSATDVEEGTRLDEARRFARRLGRASLEEDRFLLVAMSATPVVARSWAGPGPGLRAAIDSLEVTEGEADLAAGLRFASAALTGREHGQVWILGDGAFNLDEARSAEVASLVEFLEASSIGVSHHRCGTSADNAAIIRFALRQDLRDRIRFVGQLEIARMTNGDDPAPLPARLEVRSGGHPVLTRRLELSSESEVIWLDLLSPPSRLIEAHLTPGDRERDHLESDNDASITLPEDAALRVLAVSPGNTYLQAALLLSPTWEAEWAGPGEKPSASRYDVVILDGDVPMPDVQTTGILAIRPSGEQALVASDGEQEAPGFESYEREHPITRWINLYNVNVGSALDLVAEKGDTVLGRSREGPLIVLREPEDGPRILALAFELSASDLPMRAAWPLMFLNTINYLGGESLEVASSTASPRESRIEPRWVKGARHYGSPPEGMPRKPPLWLVLVVCVTAVFLLEWLTYHKRITV